MSRTQALEPPTEAVPPAASRHTPRARRGRFGIRSWADAAAAAQTVFWIELSLLILVVAAVFAVKAGIA